MATQLQEVEFTTNPLQRVVYILRRRGKQWLVRLALYLVLIDLAFVYFLPLAYFFLTSLKSPLDLVNPTVKWLPTTLFWDNYVFAWDQLGYAHALLRTVLFVVLAMVGQVGTSAIAGYAFARYRFRWVELLFMVAIFTILVPPQSILVSLYYNYRLFHWLNTWFPLVVPEWLAQGLFGAFFIFIFRQAFKALPWELEEAARIDGANAWQIFTRVMLPLARPALAVAIVFSVVWHWNDTFGPSNFLMTDYKQWPLSMELANFTNSALSAQNAVAGNQAFLQASGLSANVAGPIMAAGVLVILPPMIFYILIQRMFVEGVERSGLIE